MNIAIIFAGGRGQRLNGAPDSIPKQFLEINKKPILIHTLSHFQQHPEIDKIYISMLSEYIDYTEKLVREYERSLFTKHSLPRQKKTRRTQ